LFPGFLRIDVVKVIDAQSIELTFSKRYPVTWGNPSNAQYLKWLLLDVNENGCPDLVALINTDDSTLTTVVFPNIPGQFFNNPTVTTINIPNSLFNPTFFQSVLVKPAVYEYPSTKVRVKTAILHLFDNYQLLGGRLLAPTEPRSFNYELKGQTPSIAGQTTVGSGSQYPGDWQGLLAAPISA
jgi:hypothetical protein